MNEGNGPHGVLLKPKPGHAFWLFLNSDSYSDKSRCHWVACSVTHPFKGLAKNFFSTRIECCGESDFI